MSVSLAEQFVCCTTQIGDRCVSTRRIGLAHRPPTSTVRKEETLNGRDVRVLFKVG